MLKKTKKIARYELEARCGECNVQMFKNSRIFHCGVFKEFPTLWVEYPYDEQETVIRTFDLIDDSVYYYVHPWDHYIGTIIIPFSDPMIIIEPSIFHIYEVITIKENSDEK